MALCLYLTLCLYPTLRCARENKTIMNNVKKYGAIAGGVALVLCWPLAVGKIGQTAMEKFVGNLNGSSVSAKIVSYDRGYLSSVVKTEVDIKNPTLLRQLKADGMPTSYVITSDVSHGLYRLTSHSMLDGYADFPVTLDTVTQLNGNTKYKVNVANWHVKGKDKSNGNYSISMSPSYLSGDVSVLGKASFKLDIPSIELDFGSGEKMLISSITGQGLGKRDKGFWLGEQTINLGELKVVTNKVPHTITQDHHSTSTASMKTVSSVDEGTAKVATPAQKNTIPAVSTQHTTFDLKDGKLHFRSSLGDKGERIDAHHTLSVKTITMADGTQASDLMLDATLGNIDKLSFEKITELLQKSESMTNDDIQHTVPYVNSLFDKGFYLAVNQLSMKVGKGEFRSDLKFVIPAGTANVVKNPMVLLTALQGHLNTFLNTAMVKDYPFMQREVDSAVASKMMTKTDKGYDVKAKIEQGNLVFENGHKIPLLGLFIGNMVH